VGLAQVHDVDFSLEQGKNRRIPQGFCSMPPWGVRPKAHGCMDAGVRATQETKSRSRYRVHMSQCAPLGVWDCF